MGPYGRGINLHRESRPFHFQFWDSDDDDSISDDVQTCNEKKKNVKNDFARKLGEKKVLNQQWNLCEVLCIDSKFIMPRATGSHEY